MRSALSEPLLHFLLAGGLLYGLFAVAGSEPAGTQRIDVGAQQLAAFAADRDPAIDPGRAAAWIGTMPEDERDLLLEDYIRHQVLYREAVRLGLESTGYAERRRLINRLQYVNDAYRRETILVTEADQVRWFEARQADYATPAKVTFTHIFHHGQASDDAFVALQDRVRSSRAGFNDATRFGDRFLYHTAYVNRTEDEVAAHFGEAFARRVFSLAPSADRWHGPVESMHGNHLVLLLRKQDAAIPEFETVRRRVYEDIFEARLAEARQAFYQQAAERYEVRVEPSLSGNVPEA